MTRGDTRGDFLGVTDPEVNIGALAPDFGKTESVDRVGPIDKRNEFAPPPAANDVLSTVTLYFFISSALVTMITYRLLLAGSFNCLYCLMRASAPFCHTQMICR